MFPEARNASSSRAQILVYATFLGLGYLLFYGWLLTRSGGLPFVMDNNESFSSLWHAINIDRFGLWNSHGLTDEAYGASAAAHPYVYTHQGNFPRLVAFVFYTLGARSIEAQIIVTTFSVGLASMFFAYRFLGQLTSNWAFSALACAIIFSDYILVVQWQVVTYRVWHGFFFFATLLCIHGIEGTRPFRASLLLLVITACLFYFELVFATFVAMCAGLYALFRNVRRVKRLSLTAVALIAGAAIGVGTLCAQIVLQIGWDNFVKDATYTFISRNHFADDVTSIKALREFYESNHIVFWYNLFDASGFRTPMHLGASILYYELQPHTPYFVMLLLFPAIGYLAARFSSYSKAVVQQAPASQDVTRTLSLLLRFAKQTTRLTITLILPALLLGTYLFYLAGGDKFGMLEILGLVFALPLATLAYLRIRAPGASNQAAMAIGSSALLLGMLPSIFKHFYALWTQLDHLSWTINAFAGTYLLLLLWNFHLGTTRSTSGGELSACRRTFEVSFFIATSLVLAVVLIGSPLALGWRPLGGELRGVDIVIGALATVIVFIAIVRMSDTRDTGWRDWLIPGSTGSAVIDCAWRFNIVVLGILFIQAMMFNQAYQPIWQALGEEVLPESGRRILMVLSVLLAHILLQSEPANSSGDRGDDLLPKVGMLLIAGYLAYIVVYMLTPGYVFSGYRFRLTPLTVFLTDVVIACGIWLIFRAVMAIAAKCRINPGWGIAAASLPLLFWAQQQFAQITLMPPDLYSVLKTLSSPPYRGASFVSNIYAAPIAAFTQQWAYIDPELAKAQIVSRDGALRLKTDDSYIWLADRATNKEYGRPQYFICMVPQSLPSLAARLRRDRGDGNGYPGCAGMGLVRFAQQRRTDVMPRAELVAIDTEGPAKFGHATWAIVKLDWGP